MYKIKKQEVSLMADKKEEKLNITNDLLDAMLVGVRPKRIYGEKKAS